ncbi:IclR family transcriptional regulator [Haloarcula marismortui]|uniref:IclR family transcriptional regulator n=1 Tax=Haloarcula marismortui ATCC 33800 TaxID=662476 RepID=M0JS86_9EURY|nr:IclR family transcriptional regulator [Haloarcula sinaiiensis]EMA11253.1 IclR family transcriptional regulator [Haloarcula sinaiiensis ATCC 33800]QUJ73776.1 IclR family transcriptional regulator [Haloarcula sinaiiensis ATCC 33800]
MDEQYPVQTTAMTMMIVEELLNRQKAGVTELARELNLSKGAIHNHLQTLQQLDFVVQEGREYRVGSRFLNVASRARAALPAYQAARSEVSRLARSSGEVAALVIEEHGTATYILVRGSETDETDIQEGTRRPLYADAAGRAILAHQPEEDIKSRLMNDRRPPEDSGIPSDKTALINKLRTVREQSVAFDREERADGTKSVAAPLTTDEEHAVGAVCVTGPADRMTGKRLEEDITGLVVSSASSISVDLF